MTVQHAIVAFPRFDTRDRIESVRRRLDPLAGVLDAHVTLVFPFAASAGLASLREHLSAVAAGTAPFTIELAPPTIEDGTYLFLHVTAGRQQLIALHDQLYAGPLARHRSHEHRYQPHVTIGRVASPQPRSSVVDDARTALANPGGGQIDALAVFRLDDGTRGSVEFTVPLGNSRVAG